MNQDQGDTIQELLQTKDLTLDQTIIKCRRLEAVKKSRAEIQHTPDAYSIQVMSQTHTYIGCGGKVHDGGRKNCPAYKRACRRCGKIGHFSKVCRQGLATNSPKGHTQGAQNPPRTYTLSISELPFVQITSRSIKTAPTIAMEVSTPDGQATLQVLPDSGADICAAGPHLVRALGEHTDNLAESTVIPKAVNGSLLHPTGKIPNVIFELNGRRSSDDVHIYESVSGTIISWSVAQLLGILPANYPNPSTLPTQVQSINLEESLPPSTEAIMSEFPSVFNG